MTQQTSPILVLGMHRSGTSYLASVLRGMGVHMGERLLEADRGNPRGYHEDRDVLAFHERLLRARLPDSQGRGAFLAPMDFRPELTDEEQSAAAELVSQQRREGHWGWKEPRTCLFLDHWLRALPGVRCVAVYRHPLEVYFSFLKRRDWSALLAPEAVFEAYAAYNAAILRARDTAPDQFLVLNAALSFSDVPALSKQLAEFLDLPEAGAGSLPPFASGEFSDLGVTEEQNRLLAHVYPHAAQAYEAMQAVAEAPADFADDGTRAVLPPALISLISATLEAREHDLAQAAVAAAEQEMGGQDADSEPGELAGPDTAPAADGQPQLETGRDGLHGLVDSLCLNVPPATLQQLKAAIVAEIEAAHNKLRDERDRYIALHNEFFPLYERYHEAWKGCENTLHGTRRWIHEDLMPIVRQHDPSEARRNQAASVARQVLDRDGGLLSMDNAAARHAALPRQDEAMRLALYYGGRGPFLGATSLEEQVYIEWLASCVDLSSGAVVDLGSWLGSLTKSLALGVQRNPSTMDRVAAGEAFIHAVDIFKWHCGFDAWVRDRPYAGKYADGDDFSDAFREEIRDVAQLVQVHKADLRVWEWQGGPIPLLVNDAWKTLPIACNCVRTLFPQLTRGAILVNQDYLWCTESFIHVVMYRLREWFQPLFQVPNGTTQSFLCVRPVENVPPLPESVGEITVEEVDAAFDWSRGFVGDLGNDVLPLGKAWLLAQMGEMDRARAAAQAVADSRQLDHGFIRWQIDGFKSTGLGNLLDGTGL